MLEIKGLCKFENHTRINKMDLTIPRGEMASIECSRDTSDMLFHLILGKEIVSQGEIHIDGKRNNLLKSEDRVHIGVVFENEGYYERCTVDSYLRFHAELFNTCCDYKQMMMRLGLLDIAQVRICRLSYAQKRRLSFARERLKPLKVLIFQEPILNMEKESARMVLENIEELRKEGVAVLSTSVSFKDTLLLGGQVYTLDENGMAAYEENDEAVQGVKAEREEREGTPNGSGQEDGTRDDKAEEPPLYKVDKIPARLEERMLLFNPIEIDYIESGSGSTYLYVRGERFVSTSTLNELESRLAYFGFFRCHRSYLINLQRVREIVTFTRNSYSLILEDKNKSTIPLSKGRMDDLKVMLRL